MKYLQLVLMLFMPLVAKPSTLMFSNHCIVIINGDSLLLSDNPPTGYRIPDYIESYFQLMYPGQDIHVFNNSRSGGNMEDILTNRLQKLNVPLWAWKTNNFQHVGFVVSTDNGGLTSNNMVLAHSNIYQAPLLMSDGDDTLNTHLGWASSNVVQWVGIGYVPEGTDGNETERQRNNAGTNAGWQLGVLGIDWWNRQAPSWTNDVNNNSGQNVGFYVSPAGHFTGGGALSCTYSTLRGIPVIAADTNVSTCLVDWSAAVAASTNHCTITSIVLSGKTLTFIRHDDRLPFAYDMPDGTITNDCSGAFRLIPSDMDMFKFTTQLQNLPSGTYTVTIDGVLCATLNNAQLAAGWNMFTNTVGPYWAQRKEVLGRIRDKEYVDRVTLIPGSAGDQQGMISFMSNASSQWAANIRGDAYIASLNNNASNVFYLDSLTATAALPTNHTFQITLVSPTGSSMPWTHK